MHHKQRKRNKIGKKKLFLLFFLTFFFLLTKIGDNACAHYIQTHQTMISFAKKTLINTGPYAIIHDFFNTTFIDDKDGIEKTYLRVLKEGARDADRLANGFYGTQKMYQDCWDLTQNIPCSPSYWLQLKMPGWPVGDHFYDPETGKGVFPTYDPEYIISQLKEPSDPNPFEIKPFEAGDPIPYDLLIEEVNRIGGDLDSILQTSNAADMAQHFYNQAKNEWNNFQNVNRLRDAMYNLGVALHLVQDLTVPHHARPGNEPQEYIHKEYETYIWEIELEKGEKIYTPKLIGDYSDFNAMTWVKKNAAKSSKFDPDPTISGEVSVRLGVSSTIGLINSFFRSVDFIPPISMWYPFFFRSNVGQNSIGWGWAGCDPLVDLTCETLGFGCMIDPITSSYGNTMAVAENLDTGYTIPLVYIGGYNPNEFARRIAYDPFKTGPWTITATNGPLTEEITTYAIGNVERIDFLRNMMLTGSGTTPTISWTIPEGTSADRVMIDVIDKNTKIRLWRSQVLDLSTTSFTVPEGELEENRPYIIRARLQDTLSGDIYGMDRSRSESFFDFTPIAEEDPGAVFLPTVGPDPDPTDEFGAAFMFDFDVEVGIPCFIDPYIAVGYDYKIGAGDNVRFASVTLPEVGDNFFDLYLFNGSTFYLAKKDLMAGEKFSFDPEGVTQFRVLGIAKTAELDPNNTTAFITELTFTETGKFTGTMTPLTVLIDEEGKQIVNIDIKPGSYPNCVNNDGKGVIPVAILSNPNIGFDATLVDPDSITLEGLAIRAVGKANKLLSHNEDVNFDGYNDLVVQIQDSDGAFTEGTTEAWLTGLLPDGTTIKGSDTICIVP